MSSRLLTCELIRSAASRIARATAALRPSASGVSSASESAMPTSAASGVRKSCEMAASSELRSRSDSICTVVFCATST